MSIGRHPHTVVRIAFMEDDERAPVILRDEETGQLLPGVIRISLGDYAGPDLSQGNPIEVFDSMFGDNPRALNQYSEPLLGIEHDSMPNSLPAELRRLLGGY